MKHFEQVLIRAIEFIFSICLVIMLILILIQVLLRYGFNESIGGANEFATILFGYTSALGIAVAIARREHMAISFFTERLPSRPRKVVDATGLILLFMLNIIILCYSFKWMAYTGSRMIPILQVPRWTAQMAIPIGASASALFCFIKLYLGIKGEEELGVFWTQED
ncbi:MAG: TRAP transporter small permease [Planctomycetes bacterium]|nr:TRAP transporter small permease [Planctomycetota bacterium]